MIIWDQETDRQNNMYQKNKGFIKTIVILILVIATLAYFNVDIATIVESKPVQAIWSFTKTLWTNFVAPSIEYVWNTVLRDFIFENVVDFFQQAEEQISETDFESLIDTTEVLPTTE